jgi:FAD/FMN-containing dehydrogenase
MGVFSSLDAATDGATDAREAGAAACELLDRTFLEFVRVTGAEAVLLVDVEGADAGDAATKAEAIGKAFKKRGATEVRLAESHESRTGLWELRHAASPILNRLSEQLKSMQFIEDGCVPPHRLGEYVTGVRAALARQGIQGVIFGHAGDGHVHVNPLVDVTLVDWRERVENLLDDVTGLVAALGGTLAGEHGDGRIRTPLLGRVWDAVKLNEFAKIKRKYDPAGLLNPGVKIGGTKGIGAIKYDPDLPALPAGAAAALRQVERERAYARFRIEMLV